MNTTDICVPGANTNSISTPNLQRNKSRQTFALHVYKYLNIAERRLPRILARRPS